MASVHVLFGVLGTVDERHRGVILRPSSWGRCSMPWVGGWDVAHWMAVQIWMSVVFSFDLVVSSMYLELADCTKLVHCYLSCCYPLWSVIFRFHTHLHWLDGLALCLDFSFSLDGFLLGSRLTIGFGAPHFLPSYASSLTYSSDKEQRSIL